ncbi:MAG: LuxR C-terminal-related transcriptional regulator [Coriobacteriia bacterium]
MSGPTSAISRDADTTSLTIRFLGIGFYWAWIYLSFFSTTLFANAAGLEALVHRTLLISLSAMVFVLFTVVLIANRLSESLERRLTVFMPIMAALGTLMTAFMHGQNQTGYVGLVVGSILTGLGTGWLVLIWDRAYGSLDPKRATVHVAAALVATVLIYFAVMGLPASLAIIVVALLPIMSGAMLISTHMTSDCTPQQNEPPAVPFSFPWKLALGIGVCGVAFGLVMGTTLASANSLNLIGSLIPAANGVVALLIIIPIVLGSRNLDFALVYRLVLLLMGVAFLALPLLGVSQRPLAFALARAGFTSIDALIWVQLSSFVQRISGSRLRISGGVRLSLHGGVLAGLFAELILTSWTVVSLSILSAVTVFVLIVVLSFIASEKDVARAWGLPPVSPDPIAPWRLACTEIAKDYGLSLRETEIMTLLAKGRSAARIHEELGITVRTVQTHVRNVYSKLDVHSRQDLLDLIEKHRHRSC